ncbi:MAG: IPT/TIG domain-containing protein, partial [Acidobacteriota bacterium]|nr:IPT/TIG domain-containing protein [Acidobacteriota bacterium]
MNGVVHGASYQPVVAAGSWVSIFGNNLGPAARTWNAATEIVNGKLPASLDGVSVSVDNQPAAVYYISPTQLNVEVPSNVSGTAQVKVTNAGGSTTASVSVQPVKPGFFSYPQDNVAAVRSDGAYIGPANLMDGLVTVPAKPGDQVLLFGTGFGPTVPAIPAGEVVSSPAPLANAVKIHIDTVDAVVGFAGLTGAGLYQFNVT